MNPAAAKETVGPESDCAEDRDILQRSQLQKMICAGAICLKVFLAQYSKNIYG